MGKCQLIADSGAIMTTITTPKHLPADAALRTFLVKDEADAKNKSTEYQSTWFYQCGKIAYLYILNSEWEEKQRKA